MTANKVVFSSDININDGLVYTARNISNSNLSPYQLTKDSGPYGGKDYMITISTTDPITINLPTDSINGCENGRKYYITSAIPNQTVSVTINGGTNLINGESEQFLNNSVKSLQLLFVNATSEWHII